MAEFQQNSLYDFLLRIVTIKMKIKFPCKMALELNKQPITKEVSSGQVSKFLFDQEVTLRGKAEGQTFQINLNLYTEKGTRYTSGLLRLQTTELTRQKGERIVIPIAKCLDLDAFAEIKVQAINLVSKSQLKLSRSSSKQFNSPDKQQVHSSEVKKINSDKYQIVQTKSQYRSPDLVPPTEARAREGTKTQILKTFSKSPQNQYSQIKYLTVANQSRFPANHKNIPEIGEEGMSQRPSFSESHLIREGYDKLKEKFKKESQLAKEQTHKRMLLQANQNNYKVEIMKLKLKSDTLEKEINDKNEKLRMVSNDLSELKKKDIDISFIKEEKTALASKNQLQQDTIQTLQQEIESLKELLAEKIRTHEEITTELRHELELATAAVDQQKYELDLQVKTKDAIITAKNNDLKLRTETITRQKQLIKELEDQSELKLFDFQKTLDSERISLQTKIDEVKTLKNKILKEKKELEKVVSDLLQEVERQKSIVTTLQFNKKILNEEVRELRSEISELKVVKDKHSDLLKQYRILEEQFAGVRRSLELSLQNKDINIKELMSKYEEHKGRFQKTRQEHQDRIKDFILKHQELQHVLQKTKSSLEKSNRRVQTLSKEAASLSKLNSNLTDNLRRVEDKMIVLEGEQSAHSSKYERQTANLQFVLDKNREEKVALSKENDHLKDKVEKFQEEVMKYQQDEQEVKMRNRHLEEKHQREVTKLRDNLNKYESLIKERESSISELASNIETSSNEVRSLRKKIHELQLQQITAREQQQSKQKQTKAALQKTHLLEVQLKNKNSDIQQQLQTQTQLEYTINQKETQITKIKEEVVEQKNANAKQQHIAQLQQEQELKLKQEIADLRKAVAAKETAEQALRQQLKDSLEQIGRQKLINSKTTSEFDKFKEGVNDAIHLQFTRLLATPFTSEKQTERLRDSQASNPRSDKVGKSRVNEPLDGHQLLSTLSERLQQTKSNVWKMAELNRAFRTENMKLMEQFQSQNNKYQFSKLEMHRDMQLLEDEIHKVMDEREVDLRDYDNLVGDLNSKVKEKQAIIEDQRVEIDEYNAIITGLKTDFDSNNDLNDKKVNSLNANISELNERIEYLNLNVACLEDKNHDLDQKTIEMENQIISHKELLIKQEKHLLDLQSSEKQLSKELDFLRKEYKQLSDEKTETEIKLQTEKELKEKETSLLEEEEKKTQKLNDFISGLILQKQTAIKQELEKSEELHNAQNKVFLNTQQIELLQEKNSSLTSKYEQSKEELKAMKHSVKSLEKQMSEEKSKNSRLSEKNKEKETDIQIKKEYIKDLQSRFREMRDKNYHEIKELSNELEDKTAISSNTNKELSQKILKAQSQNKKLWQENVCLKQEVQTLNQETFGLKDALADLKEESARLEEEKTTLQEELVSREFAIGERAEEVDKLEEALKQQRLNLQMVEAELGNYHQQYDLNIKQMSNQYNQKIDSLSKQHEHKVQLLEQEKLFILEKYKPLEKELEKTMLSKKTIEIEHEQSKKIYEEKVRKLEGQRLSSTLDKNNEIKQLSEQNKNHQATLHQKESVIRKLTLELEQAKLRNSRSQEHYDYLIEQNKNRQKVMAKEIESLKVKEQHSLNNKETFLTYLYQNQVEVRKIIASTIKKVMQSCSSAESERVSGVVRGLEGRVVGAMMSRFDSS